MPSSWIFQANPARFDTDAFFATKPLETDWLVSRYFDQIQPGDRVFIWRSEGNKSEPAGVVADATVLSAVREVTDSGPREFWADLDDGLAARPRVHIAFGKIAEKRGVIKRDWWKDDPILRNHLIMKMANHTTYRLEGDDLDRLERLWDRTGSDWSYEDAVAGLYAFVKTRGGPVSRLPGSPVAEVALLVGRPVSGVYNAVMNYRSLDPEDGRIGLDGASEQLRHVWSQFYGVGGLRTDAVKSEYDRLWTVSDKPIDVQSANREFEQRADQLVHDFDLSQLWQKFHRLRIKTTEKPGVRQGTSRVYNRDPVVAAIARKRANFLCEAPGCVIPLFYTVNGAAYLEVHHIHTLATGGPDTPDNVVCLCPTHHREAHHGSQADKLISTLRALRSASAASET